MPNLSTLFNGILIGSSGYAMYVVKPQAPFAFTACAIACCHGIVGFVNSFKSSGGGGGGGEGGEGGEGEAECSKIQDISSGIMELVPLPLVNIELYGRSNSPNLALGHGLFIIPLACDLISKLFVEPGEESNTETLKDLTLLGNIVSLTFLGVNENKILYLVMAIMEFCSKYGAMAIDYMANGTGPNAILFFDSIFIILTSVAVSQASEAAK